MVCKKCGNPISEADRFCPVCGEAAFPAQQTTKPKKKGKGCLIAIIVFIIIIGLIIGAVAIILPGFFKPKNLGIKTSQEAYNSAVSKLAYNKDQAPTSGDADDYEYIYGEPVSIDTKLTSEELTSFFNYNRPDYYALKNVQIRVNDDDTIEISASLDKDFIVKNIVPEDNIGAEDLQQVTGIINVIPGHINIYGKIEGEITNNRLQNFNIYDMEIMGINLSQDLYTSQDAIDGVSDMLNFLIDDITDKTGGSYDSIKAQDGELIIKGEFPSSLSREVKG